MTLHVARPAGAMVPLGALMRFAGKRPSRAERGVYYLEDPVVFVADGIPMTIGPGALTDLASVPWFLRFAIQPEDWPWQTPGIIHDHAYAELALTRRQADRWWREACMDLRAPHRLTWASWLALRATGWVAWSKNRRQLRRLGTHWRYLR